MTDEEIRSRLTEALDGSRISRRLVGVVRDLLSAETQQIREQLQQAQKEREELREAWFSERESMKPRTP